MSPPQKNSSKSIPVFALLRWAQEHPKAMRLLDLFLALFSLGLGILEDSMVWIIVGSLFLLAAIFRLGERMNLFLPKLKSSDRDKNA